MITRPITRTLLLTFSVRKTLTPVTRRGVLCSSYTPRLACNARGSTRYVFAPAPLILTPFHYDTHHIQPNPAQPFPAPHTPRHTLAHSLHTSPAPLSHQHVPIYPSPHNINPNALHGHTTRPTNNPNHTPPNTNPLNKTPTTHHKPNQHPKNHAPTSQNKKHHPTT